MIFSKTFLDSQFIVCLCSNFGEATVREIAGPVKQGLLSFTQCERIPDTDLWERSVCFEVFHSLQIYVHIMKT